MEKVNEDALEKIRKLLAKAESTESAHEAEALSAKATELMAAYTIDAALLAAKAKQDLKPTVREIFLGNGYIQANGYLAKVVAEPYRCRIIRTVRRNKTKYHQAKEGKVEIFGFDSDIDAFLILYTSLATQAHNQAAVSCPASVHLKKWKHSFITGFANKIKERLAAAQEEATAAATTSEPGTAIVLRDRSLAVQVLVNETYSDLKTFKYYTSSSDGYSSGQRAGERANLHNSNSVGGNNRPSLGR